MATTEQAQCVESVYKGTWSHRSRCQRKAGFGKDGKYCRQHSVKHMATDAPAVTWFRVDNSDYRVRIAPVRVLQDNGSSLVVLTDEGRSSRESKQGKYDRYFPTHEEAVEFYRNRIAGMRRRADELESALNAAATTEGN